MSDQKQSSPNINVEQVKQDAANPKSHGVGTFVINQDGGSREVKVAYFPESMAYFNKVERLK